LRLFPVRFLSAFRRGRFTTEKTPSLPLHICRKAEQAAAASFPGPFFSLKTENSLFRGKEWKR
jgi:hypothetical protein